MLYKLFRVYKQAKTVYKMHVASFVFVGEYYVIFATIKLHSNL